MLLPDGIIKVIFEVVKVNKKKIEEQIQLSKQNTELL